MSLPQWADEFRRLSTSSGAIGGKWRTAHVEIARGAMMAFTEPGVKIISVMCATQTMKTELMLNIIGYHAHLNPCPMLFTAPKEQAVKSFSKERLMPMIRATPTLQKVLGVDRERGGDDTVLYKEFAGGFLAMESAGSPTNLAARPIRVTLLDEIDKYTTTKEGDPIALAEERTATFPNAMHVRACSPTWEESSRIWQAYKNSDMRRAFVKCPHCNYDQTLDFFKHVHWSKTEEGGHFPYTAVIRCESCGEEWSEAERMTIITKEGAIRWRQTQKFTCCGVEQEPLKTRRWKWDAVNQIGRAACEHCGTLGVPNRHAGFQASKLYSPFITIPDLAAKWIEMKDDPETKQTFYNTNLALPFAVQALKKVEGSGLAARREDYVASVPAGVLVLTAGVDLQSGSSVTEGRIEVEVVGWGLGQESWSIAHKVFLGDPAKPDVWKELDEFLLQPWECEGGGRMVVVGTCVDSGGHNTQEAYNFARARMGRNVWAIKGGADRGGQWSPVWPIPRLDPKKTRTQGYRPVILGVNAAKEAIRQRLLIETPGPGYCHFPKERTEAWFEQLTAEQLIIEKKGSSSVRRWHLPRGRANEALDCRVYAYAALCGLHAVRKLNLERRKLLIDQTRHIMPEGPQEPDPPPAPPRVPRRSNFVG